MIPNSSSFFRLATAMSDNTYGDILANMRAFFKTGATLPIEWRREQLAALKRCIFENQDALIEAVDADLSKCRSEARLTEFAQMFAEIEFAEKKLASWMKPESSLRRRLSTLWTPSRSGRILLGCAS